MSGIAAPNIVKISLIQRYITECNVDIICLFETSLNSSLNNEDDRLIMRGYNLIRSDHPSGLQKGGVCAYYKVHIPLITRDNLCTLNNCLATEIILENEKCFLTCLYHSASQNQHKLEIFFAILDFVIYKGMTISVSYHQQNISNLLANQLIVEETLFLALILYFLTTRI